MKIKNLKNVACISWRWAYDSVVLLSFLQGAVDYGGPRKEFFALVLQQIQKEYFDPVREWSDDYETVGKIMGINLKLFILFKL